MAIMDAFLSDYKFYRKRKGGIWYKVNRPDYGGWSQRIDSWIKKEWLSKDDIIIKTENYES